MHGRSVRLFAAILILFLGAAFEDLLFAFQIGYYTLAAEAVQGEADALRKRAKWYMDRYSQ